MNSIDDFETADLPELLARAVMLKRDGHGSITARDALAEFGFSRTVDYLAFVCELVLKETGLLPHVEQRSTLYGRVHDEQQARSLCALPLRDVEQTPYVSRRAEYSHA
jgi:hypothetical protein